MNVRGEKVGFYYFRVYEKKYKSKVEDFYEERQE